MDLREQALLVIKQILKDNKDFIGLKTFARTPGATIDPTNDKLPAVIMSEGMDAIDTRMQRGAGYPARRNFEVTLEMVAPLEYDIKAMYRRVRSKLFENSGQLVNNAFIREGHAEGPSGYDIPGIQGMRLVLVMIYIDSGN